MGDPLSFGGEESPATAAAYADPFEGMAVQDSSAASQPPGTIPEVSALREWESKHNEELEEMSQEEVAKKSQLRAAAASEMAQWQEERLGNIKKKRATNRSEEEAFADNNCSVQGDTPWERIVNLVDLNARSSDECRDTTRMRNLHIHLKASPPVKVN